MLLIDWIAVGVMGVSLLIGLLLGFGKLLKIFTGGIVGIIISIVVTYFCLGIVSSWGFVQDIMAKLIGAMQNANNGIVDFLIKIGIEKIILAVGLFIIIQVIRIILVSIIKSIVEIDNVVFKVINKFFGVIFMVGISCMVALIVFHIIQLIGGGTLESVRSGMEGSTFKIDWVFDHNPLQYIIQKVVPPTAFN
ncbi:MAG: hypothetical protein HFJ81_06265 [Clostridia bacterium]|nr:hypothetical protein [Clostridia bacterium]